ncbi:Multidrug efflux pump subunit AcrB [Candidatus Bealeia paramacronuclearis]|uniref:Multidrug efflux pump subunit AcrB n=1 Tax=Candidatus Bealeia paramacronuclearis TaxID=1921001 RepID=A0ABZ2C0Q3_9PROT|nr:Multidrug efflux pump subunit AcrB [Candidatus Bealeia paramacronuclearis]
MRFVELLIRRPVLATVMSIIIVMVGAVSYTYLPVRQFPEVDKPLISVRTQLEGASPQIVEQQLTRPLEEALGGLQGLEYMTSRSGPDESVIKLNFRIDRDMDAAAADVRDRLSRVRNTLPDEAQDPEIKKADADAAPTMFLALVSERKTVSELADYANRFLKSELETLKGVSSVEIYGGGNIEMHLVLDPVRLNAYKITATDIAGALKKQNIKKPAGRLKGEEREYQLTTTASLKTQDEFNNLIIADREGKLIRLKDVGHAELNSEDTRFISRFNGQNAVGIGIIKQSTANPLEIAKELYTRIDEIRASLPASIKLEVSSDNTVFIQRSVDEVYSAIWEASILVILVVFFFLHSIRASLIPLVTIPISLIGAFALMYAFGFSINLLTLLALVLAIGLVVDDAIVVVENVYRYIEKGLTPMEAAIKGTKEISFAVVAMTLTLAAVYAPVALSTGMTGKLFTEFSITLAGAVLVSGFIALTLSPMMCSRLLVGEDHPGLGTSKLASYFNKFATFMTRILDALDNGYASALKSVLHFRLYAVIGALVIAGSGAYIGKYQLEKELAPREDQGTIRSSMLAPAGATLKAIDRHATKADQILSTAPEIMKRMMVIQVGEDSYSMNTLVPWEDRTKKCSEIAKELKPELAKIPGLQISVYCPSKSLVSGSSGEDLSFVIQTSRSYDDLMHQMQRIWAAMGQHPGIEASSIQPDVGAPVQDYKAKINIDKAATLGVDPENIAQTLDTLIGGRKSTNFERENKQYPVRVWVGENFRKGPQDVLAMYVRGSRDNKETYVPLSDLIEVISRESTPEVNHFDGLRAVTLDARLKEGYGLGQVLTDVEAVAKRILPDGYFTTVSGGTRDYIKESYTLYMIFGLALAFIFLVMAAQFESFVDPLIIILSVPLSLAGAVLTLWLTPTGTLNIYSQIGLVTLIGLITKHGILIIDFANKLQDEGMRPFEAVMEAARLRLRPILMTTFAMVLGAIPLALASGPGAETREQIGWVIVGGMSFGTLFTLFLIPAVYTYLSRRKKVEDVHG